MNIFVYGLSGAGKDTIANHLRDEHNYYKLRIAGTIKQHIMETHNLSFDKLESLKREYSFIRKKHNTVGNDYDSVGTQTVGTNSSIIRTNLLANKQSLEFDAVNTQLSKNTVICDVRTIEEATVLLKAGWYGIFLLREANEFKDAKHKTEQHLFKNERSYAWVKNILIKDFDNYIIVDNTTNGTYYADSSDIYFKNKGKIVLCERGLKANLLKIVNEIISNKQ